ncbi:MAG: hypothetical protein IJ545_03330 [Alphaproteobacteria bacterium]|nr:hypothetical protein [Alphaproteobacteria bacterium]
MKNFILILGYLSLPISIAFAADNYTDTKTFEEASISAVEDFANRLNTVKPEQYIETVAPVQNSVRQTVAKMSPDETQFMIGLQNRLNKDMAEKNNEPKPADIKIDPNDKKAVERMLTPDIYTYDDVIPDVE